jgi:hypothetical protein
MLMLPIIFHRLHHPFILNVYFLPHPPTQQLEL